mgnify:CR=1 FL=1
MVYIAFNEMWRLRRMYGEEYYRQFWGQMIYRLGLSHALGSHKRFVVRTDKQKYRAGEQALITVEAFDKDFQPLDEKELPDGRLLAEFIVPDREGAADRVRAITVPQEVVLRLRSPTGSEALTIKLKGTDAMTGSLVIPSDAPTGVWYAYPVSFSDDAGNVTTVSFLGEALSQAVVGAASAVTATAASFTVQGPPMGDLSGITPVDLGGFLPDMTKPFPTRLLNVTLGADPTPPVAGTSAPKVTAIWE